MRREWMLNEGATLESVLQELQKQQKRQLRRWTNTRGRQNDDDIFVPYRLLEAIKLSEEFPWYERALDLFVERNGSRLVNFCSVLLKRKDLTKEEVEFLFAHLPLINFLELPPGGEAREAFCGAPFTSLSEGAKMFLRGNALTKDCKTPPLTIGYAAEEGRFADACIKVLALSHIPERTLPYYTCEIVVDNSYPLGPLDIKATLSRLRARGKECKRLEKEFPNDDPGLLLFLGAELPLKDHQELLGAKEKSAL